MAKGKIRTNKLGLPVHIGPKTKTLMRKRIMALQRCLDKERKLVNGLPVGRKLTAKDIAYVRKHLSAYTWQMGQIGKNKKRRAS